MKMFKLGYYYQERANHFKEAATNAAANQKGQEVFDNLTRMASYYQNLADSYKKDN